MTVVQVSARLTGRLTRLSTLPSPLLPVRNSGMRPAAAVPAVRRQLALQLSGPAPRRAEG